MTTVNSNLLSKSQPFCDKGEAASEKDEYEAWSKKSSEESILP